MNKLIFFIIILFLFQGCVVKPHFIVNVDSITAPNNTPKKTFYLIPGMENVHKSDIHYREYEKYVEKALLSEGFKKISNIQNANIAIFLSYGIGDPETYQYSYLLPTWGQTGVSASNTTGSVNVFGNTGTYSQTTTYTPKYGVTGYQQRTGYYTNYFRFMILEAIDLDEYRKSEKAITIWKTTVTSSGSSGDLRRVFPVLVGASKKYIGRNTGQNIIVKLRENDLRVLKLK